MGIFQRPTNLGNGMARLTVLAVGVGLGCSDIFLLVCYFCFLFSLSLGWMDDL